MTNTSRSQPPFYLSSLHHPQDQNLCSSIVIPTAHPSHHSPPKATTPLASISKPLTFQERIGKSLERSIQRKAIQDELLRDSKVQRLKVAYLWAPLHSLCKRNKCYIALKSTLVLHFLWCSLIRGEIITGKNLPGMQSWLSLPKVPPFPLDFFQSCGLEPFGISIEQFMLKAFCKRFFYFLVQLCSLGFVLNYLNVSKKQYSKLLYAGPSKRMSHSGILVCKVMITALELVIKKNVAKTSI